MKVSLTIDGKEMHGFSNPYAVLDGLLPAYLNAHEFAWCVEGNWVPVNLSDICPVCNRHVSEASVMRNTKSGWVICNSLDVNHKAGYALRICIDCKYWIMHYEGYELKNIPKTIRMKIEQGFRPSNIDFYLS